MQFESIKKYKTEQSVFSVNLRHLENLSRLYLGLVIALVAIVCVAQRVHAQSSGQPQIFYVSPYGDDTDGSSWAHAWTRFSHINWSALQAASDATLPNGLPYPGAIFNGSVTVVLQIDGGTNFIEYDEPLIPILSVPNPYATYPVISPGKDPGHNGTVVINGAKFGPQDQGKPGIDLSYQFGCWLWGTATGYQDPWPNASGRAQPQWAVVNCPVGVYTGTTNYAWVFNLLLTHNGVGMMAAALQDLPSQVVGGVALNVQPSYIPGGGLGYQAGSGLHVGNCWITDSTDMNYHTNVWIQNSASGNPSDDPSSMSQGFFSNGYPHFGNCLISAFDYAGQLDGITFFDASNEWGFHWFQVEECIFGPGLVNGLYLNQQSAGIDAMWCLFLNPAGYAIVKQRPGDVAFAINCISAMTPLNANSQAHGMLGIVENTEDPSSVNGQFDGVVNCSINGGNMAVQGGTYIGINNHQINTTGNSVVISPTLIDDPMAVDPSTLPNTIDPHTLASLSFALSNAGGANTGTAAANQAFPIWPYDYLPTISSVDDLAGLPPGTDPGNGLPPGFSLGNGSGGGGGGGASPGPGHGHGFEHWHIHWHEHWHGHVGHGIGHGQNHVHTHTSIHGSHSGHASHA